MKRSMIIGLAVVALLGIVTVSVLASNFPNNDALGAAEPVEAVLNEDVEDVTVETAVMQEQPVAPTGQNFVDADGDGVCDTCGNEPGSGTGNQNGNGAMGGNFVDADGDGVCDTCGNEPGSGTGNQNGNGAMGSNFVDADGDGVCDTCGTVPADGTGSQHGRQGGQGRGGRWNN